LLHCFDADAYIPTGDEQLRDYSVPTGALTTVLEADSDGYYLQFNSGVHLMVRDALH